MDDEDGRCLLDVICDPQALNDFLHGSEKLDSDDLLDNPGEAQSAFYEGPGLHVQEASGNHLNPEPNQPAPSVDLDFLEDDILGSPAPGGGGGGGGGADQPCDILQQSLQEANITEQTLEAEAELDLGPFQLPTLQPADGGAGPTGAGGVPAPNVILHRTPTPIQPKPAGVLPPKLYQLTPKPFAPAGATLTIQGEPGALPQQPKAPQNLTFMAAGKAGQNVVLSGFPAPALQANVFKQPPATTTGAAPPQPPGALSKPMSVHLLNQGSSIVIPAQHMLPGQNQFLLPGAPAVQLPQQLSALQSLTLLASSPEKIVLGQPPSATPTAILTQDSLQMFLPQERSQQPLSAEGPHLSVPASVIVSAPPPSEPALHPCPPPQAPPTLPGIFVIQNQLGVPPPASNPAPTAPGPPQPPLRPPSQPPEGPLPPAPHLPPSSTSSAVASSSETSSRLPAPTPSDFQLQFPPGQGPHKSPTPPPTLHLVPEPAAPPPPPPRTFQMVTTPFPALPQPKALLERFHQVPSGIILQNKTAGGPAAPQTATSLGPLTSPTASVLVSGQAPSGTPTAPSHAPAPAPMATTGLPPLLPAENKAFASNLPTLNVAKAASSGPGKTSGLQYESKLSGLKKPPTLQPSKEACFLEHLHKHQGSVLHPDYKTAFPSFEDALHRLLPYHVYQGALPSPNDYHKVDEEFETVSTQLLKRTQAMLNKYRLLLLEESRRVSPSAEMVMIDRMFIQEEKTTLALDKQLAKEKPDEYVSSSRSLGLPVAASSEGHRLPGHGPPSSSAPGASAQPPPHLPTKLVIRHGGAGGSPSVTWARASSSLSSSSSSSSAASSLDADEDGPMPSRNRPPIKTYEARSRIGLKLKIKQEAGLSKVVHNTALDPVHQPPPPPAMVEGARSWQGPSRQCQPLPTAPNRLSVKTREGLGEPASQRCARRHPCDVHTSSSVTRVCVCAQVSERFRTPSPLDFEI
ncbi:PREDICTED: glioma tumor suppressor candidate region gene 1 protein [Mandrillus leucophaeus]|uniref:glioma tumor suppressor candidate region gene 1 protein n=1 Tax=Mandrillus leucophaeus TaxID=9568 RepID=UPI0005F51387|nr:PREDICTED: glioma tumor suppressor candidate region gene 1 protein [Mandrillus leucophaeus]